MNLSVLQQKYQSSPHLKQLVDRLSIPQTNTYLKNLQGSSPEFIVSAVFANEQANSINHLVVLNDEEDAAYFHNSVENLTQALDLFYFPSSFKNKKNFRLLFLLLSFFLHQLLCLSHSSCVRQCSSNLISLISVNIFQVQYVISRSVRLMIFQIYFAN